YWLPSDSGSEGAHGGAAAPIFALERATARDQCARTLTYRRVRGARLALVVPRLHWTLCRGAVPLLRRRKHGSSSDGAPRKRRRVRLDLLPDRLRAHGRRALGRRPSVERRD